MPLFKTLATTTLSPLAIITETVLRKQPSSNTSALLNNQKGPFFFLFLAWCLSVGYLSQKNALFPLYLDIETENRAYGPSS